MSDLFGNHIVGFSTRWLIFSFKLACYHKTFKWPESNSDPLPVNSSFIKGHIIKN